MTEWLKDPDVQIVLRYLTTLFGATAMYVFSLNQGFEGSVRWLKKMFPNRATVTYDRLDFLIVVLAGSLIGFISFNPSSAYEALAAGFGWVGSINVLLNKAAAGEVR
jgi:uncharacterized membrane protein YbjE (DUF340 family)